MNLRVGGAFVEHTTRRGGKRAVRRPPRPLRWCYGQVTVNSNGRFSMFVGSSMFVDMASPVIS